MQRNDPLQQSRIEEAVQVPKQTAAESVRASNGNAGEDDWIPAGPPSLLLRPALGGEVGQNEVYRFLSAYYIYQDQIGWNRTQTLVVVEAGVLAGAFSRHGPASPFLLAIGTLLVHWIYRLIKRDWEIRDHIGESLDRVNHPYGVELIPRPKLNSVRGRSIIGRVSFGLIALNLILATIETLALLRVLDPETVAAWLR